MYLWASLVAQAGKNLPAMQETRTSSLVGKIPWRREWLPTPVFCTHIYICAHINIKYIYIYISTHTHIYIAHIFVSDGKHVGSFWKNPQHTFNRWFLLERA